MPASTSIGQRFTQLIQYLGLSKNAFAQSLNKTATVVQHLVDERNKPGYDLLCKVFEVYPNVSKDWLLLGHGPMLVPAEAPASTALAIALLEPIDLAELPNLPRPRPVTANSGLQPADIAATLALAAATMPAPAPASARLVAQASAGPVAPLAATVSAAPAAAAPAPLASAPASAPVPPALPDANYLAVLLQTQQLQHQLALAEQRNQHLLEQQQLMQQIVNLLQRAI